MCRGVNTYSCSFIFVDFFTRCTFFNKKRFLPSAWMFLNILSYPALNVSIVFLKILGISHSNKATMRRETEV